MGREYMNKQVGKVVLLELCSILDSIIYHKGEPGHTSSTLPYFLIQGTALGAYRDKGFVPTELDLDIGLLWEDFNNALPTLTGLLTLCGFTILASVVKPFTKCHTLVVKKAGIKADLVSYILNGNDRFAHSPIDPVNILHPYAIVHRREMLENYDKVSMFGREFNVPHPIEEYLTLEYGDWATPREDHISRTRVYDYIHKAQVNCEYLLS